MNELTKLKNEMIEKLQERLYIDQLDMDILNKVILEGLKKAVEIKYKVTYSLYEEPQED